MPSDVYIGGGRFTGMGYGYCEGYRAAGANCSEDLAGGVETGSSELFDAKLDGVLSLSFASETSNSSFILSHASLAFRNVAACLAR